MIFKFKKNILTDIKFFAVTTENFPCCISYLKYCHVYTVSQNELFFPFDMWHETKLFQQDMYTANNQLLQYCDHKKLWKHTHAYIDFLWFVMIWDVIDISIAVLLNLVA